jgi:hypothetical protein
MNSAIILRHLCTLLTAESHGSEKATADAKALKYDKLATTIASVQEDGDVFVRDSWRKKTIRQKLLPDSERYNI